MGLLLVSIVAVVLAAALFAVVDELRHRDRHLQWVDKRDAHLVALYERAMEPSLVPRSDFLGPFFEHGHLSRNGVANAAALITESRERMGIYLGFLDRVIAEAKTMRSWEGRNPPPPVSRWKFRQGLVTTDYVPQEKAPQPGGQMLNLKAAAAAQKAIAQKSESDDTTP